MKAPTSSASVTDSWLILYKISFCEPAADAEDEKKKPTYKSPVKFYFSFQELSSRVHRIGKRLSIADVGWGLKKSISKIGPLMATE